MKNIKKKLGIGHGARIGLINRSQMRSAFPPIFPLYCRPWHTCSLATCGPDDSIRSFVTCAQFHASFMLEIGASGPGLRLRSEGVQKMPEEMENSKRSHLHGTGYNCP